MNKGVCKVSFISKSCSKMRKIEQENRRLRNLCKVYLKNIYKMKLIKGLYA
jgi:hypothetical protein